MGKLFSRFMRSSSSDEGGQAAAPAAQEPKKEYSWDTRVRVDPKEYTFEKLKNATVGKLPGTLNGQPFIIQQCEDTNVFIFDQSATITVDDCSNCNFFFGPVRGSVFIRNCKNCRAVIVCQQFRTRDCSKCDVFLACATQPIIEASNAMRIGCFQLHYEQLADQFRAAKIDMLSVNWSGVHDFTPVSGKLNFSLDLADSVRPTDIVKFSAQADDSERDSPNSASRLELASFCEKLTSDVQASVVPLTFGVHQRNSDEPTCLLLLFCDGDTRAFELDERGLQLTRAVYQPFEPPHCRLIRSCSTKMDNDDFSRIFGEEAVSKFGKFLKKPFAAFEFNGPEANARCDAALSKLAVAEHAVHKVNDSRARSTAGQFFDFLSSQMNP